MLTRSGLTYSEISSKVYQDSFCQLGSSISLPWVIYFEAFYLHVVSSIRWLHTQRVKLHLSNTKENEMDIEKEWKNLQNILKSAANESLGKKKETKQEKVFKNMG